MSDGSEPLEKWRSKISTLAIVGRRLALERSGQFSKGKCPFGCDETSSFFAYDDQFHCFGCGAHGDGVDFIVRASKTDLDTVIAALTSECGIDDPRGNDIA